MQKLVFTNGGGQSIDLTSGNFGITNWEGLSNTELNIQTQQVPFQDGGVFLDALLEQREISVTVAIQDNNDLSLRYELKRQLISALNPKLGEGVLVYTNDYLSRQIKAVPQLPIFENKNSNDSGTLKASVTFSCPSPYWEDLEETVIPITNRQINNAGNTGDVPTQVEIKLYNANNVIVQNLTNGKLLKMLNLDPPKNVKINTNNGQKKVEENLISYESVYGSSAGICEDDSGRIIQGIGNAIRVTERLIDNTEIPTLYNIGGIVFFNNYFYFNNFNTGSFYRTQDFENFELVVTVNTNYPDYFGIVNNKLFISGNRKLYYSENGTSWTEKDTTSYFYNIYGMTYWQNTYYINTLNVIYASTDLQTWTEKYSSESNLYKIAHNNSTIVCVGNGIILRSTNGSNWNELTTDRNLVGVTVRDNMFYIVGYNGALLKTIDGIEITDLTQSAYANTNFLQIINSSNWGLIIRANSGFVITFDGTILSEYNILGDCPTSNIYQILKYKSGLIARGSIVQNAYFHIFLNNKWKSFKFANKIINDIFVNHSNDILLSMSYQSGTGEEKGVYISEDDGEHFTKVFDVPVNNLQKGKNNILYGTAYDTALEGLKAYISTNDGYNWEEYGVLQYNFTNIIYSEYYNKYFAITMGTIIEGEATITIYSSDDGLIFAQITSVQVNADSFSPYLRCFGNEIIVVGKTEIYQSINGTYFAEQTVQWSYGITDLQKQGVIYTGIDNNNVLEFTDFSEISSITKILNPLSILIDNLDIYIGCGSGYIGKLAESNKTQNLIAKLSNDSDMTFNLEIGNNLIKTNSIGELRYRQKYIGV